MLEINAERRSDPRELLASALFCGEMLWSVVRPGTLTFANVNCPLFTVYHGARPWVVVGELLGGELLAMPLNDAHGNPKWFAPVIPQTHLSFRGNSKDAQLELAHLWSFPSAAARQAGTVLEAAIPGVRAAVEGYFAPA